MHHLTLLCSLFVGLYLSCGSPLVLALKCYQGQSNLPQGQPKLAECPMPSQACMNATDSQRGIVTWACQSAKCYDSVKRKMTNTGGCESNSDNAFCCCYDDGCNGSE